MKFFDLQIYDFVFKLWLPFLLSFTLLYAILEGMKIFNKRINFTIAFLATIAFTTSPLFKIFAEIFAAYAAFFVVTTFVALFFLGSFIKGTKRIVAIPKEEEIKFVEREIERKKKEKEEAEKRRDVETVVRIEREIKELEEKRKKLLEWLK